MSAIEMTPAQKAEHALSLTINFCEVGIGDVRAGLPIWESDLHDLLADSRAAYAALLAERAL